MLTDAISRSIPRAPALGMNCQSALVNFRPHNDRVSVTIVLGPHNDRVSFTIVLGSHNNRASVPNGPSSTTWTSRLLNDSADSAGKGESFPVVLCRPALRR
jgi:hypothetical protein